MADNDKNKAENKQSSIRIAFGLLKDYLTKSDHKLKAWLLLIASILCIAGIVACLTLFGFWFSGFFGLLVAKASISAFAWCLGQFGILTVALVACSTLKNYLLGKLSILWRNWLTKSIIDDLFQKDNNFLELKRHPEVVDNIAQRVQEDTGNIVDLILNLGSNVIQSVFNLGASTATLWIVGGALAFVLLGLNVVMPGYLVWVALAVAIVTTAVTYYLGRSLPQLKQNSVKSEANLRAEITKLTNDAENIARENAENYYKQSLSTKVQSTKEASENKLGAETRVIGFQSFYGQIVQIIPFVCAAPLYFAGAMELAQLMQVGTSFFQVSYALNMFADSYQNIAALRASVTRLVELRMAMEKNGLPNANEKKIELKVRNKDTINIRLECVNPPKAGSSASILRSIKWKLQPGEHILLSGKSGSGKSTLFNVITGKWLYGVGKVSVPANKRLSLPPQFAEIPENTLKAVLAYPDPVATYPAEQYPQMLRTVGMPERFIDKLDESCDWDKIFSGGERQRIIFARALLQRPAWLFLDEATSSLDEASEAYLYQLLFRELKDTTVVSIGHGNTINKFHNKVVFFHKSDNGDVALEEVSQETAKLGQ